MRRWHSEVELMKSRMRLERAKHGVEPDNRDGSICHCLLGIGFVRKKKPFDCGVTRCACCHSAKWDRRRQNDLFEALRFEAIAEDGWPGRGDFGDRGTCGPGRWGEGAAGVAPLTAPLPSV